MLIIKLIFDTQESVIGDILIFFVFQKEFADFMELLSKATVETMVKLIHDRISAQVLDATAKSRLSKQDELNGTSLCNHQVEYKHKQTLKYLVYVLALHVYFVKGIVHPKMKILSSFTHPKVVPNLYEFLSSAEHKNVF